MVEYMVLAVLALFLALIVFSIILNVRDMKWLVDFTDADAKEKLLALKLDGAEIRRYRRRRARFGRFGSSESLSDYVQIPLEAPLPVNHGEPFANISLDGESGGGSSAAEGKAFAAAKAVMGIAKGTAILTDQNDLLLVFGKKDGKEHKIYSCDFTLERFELAKDVLSVLGGSTGGY
ncbi:MAG TPA: hypothetical protein DCP61_03505 [Treponema sp.]|nr:hypothetical protein [Treponema sp.]